SLADAGFETSPLMLERGSYIPWESWFRRYLNRKRENRKWLNKVIDEGLYKFRNFTPSDTEAPRMQKEKDLRDDLKHYEAEIEAMNLILISTPNDIYNFVDAYKTAKAMWQRVERLMRGTVQNKVDRETRFNNEFDQFVVEPGKALVSVYNHFAQLMNDLERNNDAGNIQRNLRTTSSGTVASAQCYNCSEKCHYARNCPKTRVRDSKYFMEQMLLAKQDEAGVIITDEQNDFLFADAFRMEEIEELRANICLMARIQPTNFDSDAGPSYDSEFLSESLADAGFETSPLMLERGSYIPWESQFRRYLNRKRENRKWLNKAIDEGLYKFRNFTPSDTEAPRMQKEKDLRYDLKHYEAEIEAMNLILISIPNDIYNFVDACKTAKAMWQRVERLMRGTMQNKVDRETRFNNEFDQFVVEPGKALVSVYNHFAQLMNDLERNDIIF
nr:hypothetical protein [Tanacetum cinerariifolium]